MTPALPPGVTVEIERLPDGSLPQDNLDVTVRLADGAAFWATFFTPENVAEIMDRHRRSGESADGLYFWSTNMVIIRRLTEDALLEAVATMLADGDFRFVFGPLDEPSA